MLDQEQLEALTPEQRAKFAAVTNAQELDAAFAEAGLEPTPQEKELVLAEITGEVDDQHLEGVAGGFSSIWESLLETCPQCGRMNLRLHSGLMGCPGCGHGRRI